MKRENTSSEKDSAMIKLTMAILAVTVVILTIINSLVPAFSEKKNGEESNITSAKTVNAEKNIINNTYFEIYDGIDA